MTKRFISSFVGSSIVALAFAAGAAALSPASASEVSGSGQPYCFESAGQAGPGRKCDFVSLPQCKATMSGIAGSCYVNPQSNYEASARMGRNGH